MFGLDEKLIESIRNISKKYPKNKFVVFGSRARGDYKTTSDIDIAILGKCDDNIEFNIKEIKDSREDFKVFYTLKNGKLDIYFQSLAAQYIITPAMDYRYNQYQPKLICEESEIPSDAVEFDYR